MGAAVVTLFGTLSMPGAQDKSGSFREPRNRFSVAVTVLVVYLVFFAMAVFWSPDNTNKDLVQTLTNLMMVVIPFYFRASAATQIAAKKDELQAADKG